MKCECGKEMKSIQDESGWRSETNTIIWQRGVPPGTSEKVVPAFRWRRPMRPMP